MQACEDGKSFPWLDSRFEVGVVVRDQDDDLAWSHMASTALDVQVGVSS